MKLAIIVSLVLVGILTAKISLKGMKQGRQWKEMIFMFLSVFCWVGIIDIIIHNHL